MFGALIKAFTGRAGWLAGLLALLISVVVIYAAVKGTPRVEESLISDAQTLLQSDSGSDEPLAQIRAEGRDLFVDGQIQDTEALKTKLQALDGVRRVIVEPTGTTPIVSPVQSSQTEIDTTETTVEDPAAEDNQASQTVVNAQGALNSDLKISDTQENDPGTDALSSEVSASITPSSTSLVRDDVSTDTSVDQALAEEGNAKGDTGAELNVDVSDSQAANQSSLSLRYDGAKLKLTGHVGDDQLAALISQEVRNAMPGYSELESNVDGRGGVSGLNWMNQFLDAVANLPDDAQGVINGSDIEGVQILPDAVQNLLSMPQDDQQIAQKGVQEQDVTSNEGATAAIEEQQVDANDQPVVEEQVATIEENTAVATEGQAVSSDANETADDLAVTAKAESNDEAEQNKIGTQTKLTENENPSDFILSLNQRMAQQPIFASGDIQISQELAVELDQLVQMMHSNPELFLRIVGNLDFSVGPRDADYVGVDRAREIRDYIRAQGVERFRVFSAPLPRNYAFDKQVQVVFYISE